MTRLLLSILVVALAVGACGSEPVPLRVGELEFTESQLLGLSDARLDELVLIAALAEARVRGTESELGLRARERGLREARIQALREEIMLESAGVGEDDLRARYSAAPELELEVRHLVVISERWRPGSHRSAARARATEALERIESGEPFAEVAGEVSEEPGAERRGGLLEPGRAGTWVPEFWEAARGLEEGGVSGVVETEFGFHVLKLESRTELPFEEGRARVMRAMAAELGGVEGWEDWREARLAELELDAGAIGALHLEGAGPPRRVDPVEGDDPVLARWSEGSFRASHLVETLQGARSEEWTRIRDASAQERVSRIGALAERHLLDTHARDRGVEAPEEARSRLEREWEQRIVSWTAFLDLPEDLRRDEAAERTLDALRSSDQNARIARSELREWSPVLYTAFDVERPEPRTQ